MALKKLTLPSYFETEETISLEKQGLDCDVSMSDIQDITLYEKPFAISPFLEKRVVVGTRISINSDYFISSLKPDEVDALIEATWG